MQSNHLYIAQHHHHMTQSDCHNIDAQTTAAVYSSVHQASVVPLRGCRLCSPHVCRCAAKMQEGVKVAVSVLTVCTSSICSCCMHACMVLMMQGVLAVGEQTARLLHRTTSTYPEIK
jgi:hypothetical protein